MKKALLIQANGNNMRLSSFFKQPKYELFYNGLKIIEHIYKNVSTLKEYDIFLALRQDAVLTQINKQINVIRCKPTYSRIDTLKEVIPHFKKYHELLIHDCDVIISSDVLKKMNGNCIAVSTYKNDGLKYGFIELDDNFQYLKSNEKEYESDYISIGAYSVNLKEFKNYIKNINDDSLLYYFNTCTEPKVVYSKTFINLGDIDSYINNLWKL